MERQLQKVLMFLHKKRKAENIFTLMSKGRSKGDRKVEREREKEREKERQAQKVL
jgi:hypothetical protein